MCHVLTYSSILIRKDDILDRFGIESGYNRLHSLNRLAQLFLAKRAKIVNNLLQNPYNLIEFQGKLIKKIDQNIFL